MLLLSWMHAKKMRAVVSKNPEMEAGLVYAQELNAFFDVHASDPFNQLIQLMQNSKLSPDFMQQILILLPN